jgi:hypothetical protein
MKSITLTDDEIKLCEEYVEKYYRKEDSIKFNSYRDYTDSENPNLMGVFGEVVVNKYFRKSVADTLKDRPLHHSDAGYDIVINNLKFDVKTHSKIYKSNLINTQDKCNDGYILVSRKDINTYLIFGWIHKSELPEKAEFHKRGEYMGGSYHYGCDMWVIQNDKLHDIKELKNMQYKYTPNIWFDLNFEGEQKALFDKLHSF